MDCPGLLLLVTILGTTSAFTVRVPFATPSPAAAARASTVSLAAVYSSLPAGVGLESVLTGATVDATALFALDSAKLQLIPSAVQQASLECFFVCALTIAYVLSMEATHLADGSAVLGGLSRPLGCESALDGPIEREWLPWSGGSIARLSGEPIEWLAQSSEASAAMEADQADNLKSSGGLNKLSALQPDSFAGTRAAVGSAATARGGTMRWLPAEAATQGLLPPIDEITKSCYLVGTSSTGQSWFICTAPDLATCEEDAEMSEYYGQPIYMCQA